MHLLSAPPIVRHRARPPLGGSGVGAPLGRLLPPAPRARPSEPTAVEAVRLDEGRIACGRIATRVGWSIGERLTVEMHPHHLLVRRHDPDVTAAVPTHDVNLDGRQARLRVPAGWWRLLGLASGDTVLAWLHEPDGQVELMAAWAFSAARSAVAAGDLDPAETARLRDEVQRLRTLLARVTAANVYRQEDG